MRVHRIVDLSLAIDPDTQVYPGDPQVRFAQAATIAADGFNLLKIEMGSQSGTNCDAPRHFLAGADPIDEVPLQLFAGPGLLMDLRHKAARSRIERTDIEAYLSRTGHGTVAVLHTGWSRHYRTPAYFDHPFLAPAACAALLDAGVRTFCIDAPSIDETPDDTHPGAGFPVHLLIAQAGGVIVENLASVDEIDFPDPFITLFPLKFTGADGSPTRAVAMQLAMITST